MIYLVLAAVSGAAMAFQGAVNAVLGEKCGEFQASFIVHLGGTLILFVWLLVKKAIKDLIKVKTAPWWSLLGAPLSVLIIFGVLSSIRKTGVSKATTAIVSTQIVTAIVLDYFGITGQRRPFDVYRIAGAVLFAVGTYLLLGERN